MKKITTIILAVLFTANLIAQVPNYVPTNGLVGWWPFNGNANDESGNGNNGTVNGATLTTDRFNNINSSYNFIGDNTIKLMYNNMFTGSTATISTWIRIDSFPKSSDPQSNIFGKGWGYPQLILNKNGKIYLSIANSSSNFSVLGSKTTLNLNTWYHITTQFSGSNFSIYINGNLDTFKNFNPIPSYYSYCNSEYFIGGFNHKNSCMPNDSTQFFKGKIDDLGYWNRLLTQTEITDLYNACNKNISISPQNNSVNIGNTATFTANTVATSPNYIWQSDLGQGFQTLNNIGKYSGTSTNTMSISNVQLSNHMDPIRAISVSGNCRDTSNIAYVKITDTCITKINDTIKITKYDTITTKITKYDTIKVIDTLVINATLSGISAPNNTNRIIVYPNPAKDHITIDYGVFSKMSGYTMKITNTLGQTVFSSPINQQSSFINLSSWTGKGVYYLQIIDKQNSIIENRKIILQ
jgi:hypothetical protein